MSTRDCGDDLRLPKTHVPCKNSEKRIFHRQESTPSGLLVFVIRPSTCQLLCKQRDPKTDDSVVPGIAVLVVLNDKETATYDGVVPMIF